MQHRILVKCTIKHGLFSSEVVATINTTTGQISFLSDRQQIVERGDGKAALVNLVRDDGDRKVVLLPNPSMESGSRWAVVKSRELEAVS